ncbi:MARVEL domain-containing protein 3 [Lampris incognitus]|uniref:MARVEL domain-containing protein 3 n=1 Tax=Lampris incognitus TaxID=2546036 RepID=UPI0024B5370D|nr:MARVEL domain-containing protein 3 [Lampris incognitus]
MNHQPRTNRGHRDRNGDPGEHRQHRHDRDPHAQRPPPSDRSSSRPPYYPRDTTPPPKHARDVPREEHRDSKCTHICSRRGIVLICSVLTNSLVLICVVAAQMVTSGISAMGGLGSFNINSNFNLQGTELKQVRDLDMQYSQMRAPGIYGGITFSLTFGVVSLLFVVSGNKPPHLLPQKLLIGAVVFQGVGAAAYVVAVGLYLHFVIGVNSTEVCQRRERIYARNGYTWMNCDVGGADAAVALFGLFTAILYAAGTVITFQTIRGVKRFLRERKQHEAERRQPSSSPQRAPLRPETTAV